MRPPRPRSAGRASAALACAIVGVFICGPILGIVALVLAGRAQREIDSSNGRLGGDGMVIAARIVAVFDFVVPLAVLALAA